MRSVVATGSALALSEVEVGVHKGIWVDEPGIDIVDRVVHIDLGAVDNPGKGVV